MGLLYRTVLGELAWLWWNDEDYSHGLLVPLFCGFVIWQRRERLRTLTPRGEWLGLPVLIAGLSLLLLGDLLVVNFAMRSSIVLVLAGLVLFHLGREVLKVLAFPLLFFLLFAGPLNTLYAFVTVPLQGLAARNAAGVLDLLGVPVLLDGNVIQLSQISLGVTEACSGIRSLVSLVALAVAWATLTGQGGRALALLVGAAIPITVIANAGRIVATGLIGQWFGVEHARGFFHAFSGWVVFVLACLCLLAFAQLSRGLRRRRSAS